MSRSKTGIGVLVTRFIDDFSLKQINSLAIIFVLTFTVLFSTLLIFDESNHFARTLDEERRMYVEVLSDELEKTANAIETMTEASPSNLLHAADAFSRPTCCTVLVYDGARLVWHEPQVSDYSVKTASSRVASGSLVTVDGEKEALLLERTVEDGYRFVVGIYTSSMDANMKQRQHEMKSHLIRIVLEIATLAFILFAFSLGISSIVNTLIEKDVRMFLDFFKEAANSDRVLNPKTTFFREFRIMVGYANGMVGALSEKKQALQALNASLEIKVQEKTAELESKNRYAQDLLASQKLFIRHAIHETNTPLAVMLTNMELLELKEGKNRYLSKIGAAMKNIVNIFEDLSYLLKRNQVEYPRRRIDLVDYVRSRVDFFAEVAQQNELVLVLRTDVQHVDVWINETRLQRIIDNNLTNAIKYSRQNEEIAVLLEPDATGCVLQFVSHSKMIQHPEKVFEAYYREGQNRSGFGLGLNLVKQICDEENVVVTLYSDESATTFTYHFERYS